MLKKIVENWNVEKNRQKSKFWKIRYKLYFGKIVNN